MIRAAAGGAQAVRRYDLLSPIYALNAALGSGISAEAIAAAGIGPAERVLDLATGTGRDALRLAARVSTGAVIAADLSAGMLRVASRTLARAGAVGGRVALVRADAARLPLADGAMDLVFSSRLLDLVDTPLIQPLIGECRRVLRPGGRIVLINMSKPGTSSTLFERLYSGLAGFAGLLFISRPVLAVPFLEAAGFTAVSRTFHRGFPVGSEIAIATRPSG